MPLLHESKSINWVNRHTAGVRVSAPYLVLVDRGMARRHNTETMHGGIYAFIFDQKGLMGGRVSRGSKIPDSTNGSFLSSIMN